jgi:hypothetical protein
MGKRGLHVGFWWGKPEGKRSLRKPRRRWEDIRIKMDLREIGWGDRDFFF